MLSFLVKVALATLLVVVGSSPSFSESAVTPIPARFFCHQHPDICRGGGAGSVVLTSDVLAILQSVNAEVNRSIISTSERVDVWTINPRRGDCEDYALTKRAALVRLGLPRNSLRIGVGFINGSSAHAVLVILTDKGSLVLDNVNRRITTLQENGISLSTLSTGSLLVWNKYP